MRELIEQFYIDNYDNLCKKLYYRANTYTNAEDIVQEAFARALKYADSFDPRRSEFGAWFNSILLNSFNTFMVVERNNGVNPLEFDEDKHDPIPMDDELYDLVKNIKIDISNKPSQVVRDALYLHFVKGFKPREMCEVLDLTNNNVRIIIYRFKKEMEAKYGS